MVATSHAEYLHQESRETTLFLQKPFGLFDDDQPHGTKQGDLGKLAGGSMYLERVVELNHPSLFEPLLTDCLQ
jgi:hypothetical protein